MADQPTEERSPLIGPEEAAALLRMHANLYAILEEDAAVEVAPEPAPVAPPETNGRKRRPALELRGEGG